MQVGVTLQRMGKPSSTLKLWVNRLSREINLDPSRIPVKLSTIKNNSVVIPRKEIPVGLNSVKGELEARFFPLKGLNVHNYYDLLKSMFINNTFFYTDIQQIEYYPRFYKVCIKRGFDYSSIVPKDVPWIFRKLYVYYDCSQEDILVRDILQSTKSYDGPVDQEYYFWDIESLIGCLISRGQYAWKYHE